VVAYQGRLGGPLIDRIDMQLDVWRTSFDSVVHAGSGLSSAQLREGVLAAREFRAWREARVRDAGLSKDGGKAHAEEEIPDLLARNDVDAAAELFLRDAAASNSLSGRSIVRTVSLARTIADMEESQVVGEGHMAEAFGLRLRDSIS
jgi:magnesium chelatase family protein